MNSPWLLVTFHFKFKSVLCSLFSLNLPIIRFLCDLDPTVPWEKNAFLPMLLCFSGLDSLCSIFASISLLLFKGSSQNLPFCELNAVDVDLSA